MVRRSNGRILTIVAAFGTLAYVTLVWLMNSRPLDKCFYTPTPAGAVSPEEIPTGELLWWPVGLRCVWRAADGGYVEVGPGPGLTIGLVLGLTLTVAGILMWALPERSGIRSRR